MQAPSRPRPSGPLAVTTGHIYALGAMSLALSTLTFFLGLQLGRGVHIEAPAPAVPALLDEEARTGSLEALLMRVDANQAPPKLVFPQELRTPTPPLPPLAEPGADPATAPVVPPPPSIVAAAPAPDSNATAATAGMPAPETAGVVPGGGWAIQVATRASSDEAAHLVQTLRASGMDAYSVQTLVDGHAEHRVRIGGYSSETAATTALPEVRGRAGAPGASVTRAP